MVQQRAEVAVTGLRGDPVDRTPFTAAVVAWPERWEWPVTGMPSNPARRLGELGLGSGVDDVKAEPLEVGRRGC